MRFGGKQILSLVAITAIVLHAILWGVAPLSAAPALDPFSVICHSETQAIGTDQTPDGPAPATSHTCDHCNVCSANAPPAALDSVVAALLVPAQLLHALVSATVALRDGLADNPNRARGPPHFA